MDPAVWGGARSQVRLWDWGQKLRENKISPRCPRRRRKKKLEPPKAQTLQRIADWSLKEQDSSRVRERGSSCSSCSSSRFVLQARGCDRQWLQLLVMMKNCSFSLGVSSACLFLLQRRWQSEQREATDGMDGLDRMARTQWTIRWRLGVAKKDAAGPDPKRAGRIPPWKKAGPGHRTMGSVINGWV